MFSNEHDYVGGLFCHTNAGPEVNGTEEVRLVAEPLEGFMIILRSPLTYTEYQLLGSPQNMEIWQQMNHLQTKQPHEIKLRKV